MPDPDLIERAARFHYRVRRRQWGLKTDWPDLKPRVRAQHIKAMKKALGLALRGQTVVGL